ncbi:MAG: urease accessory protein UreF [Proteobacteria bacterium]|nr:urease accessory protein UreF [Pseudomonadota bacterium]
MSPPAAGIARTLQFGESMFPVGGFAFSGGLESAIQKGVVVDRDTLAAYVRTALEQAAQGDGIAVIHAHRAATAGDLDTLGAIDARVFARKLSGEARTMTTRMGKKFAEMSADIVGTAPVIAWRERIAAGATPGCYPVSLAVNFAAQGLAAHDAFVVHQFGVASTILSASLRLMKVSHVDTQRMLFALLANVDADHARAATARLDDMAGFAPMAEILAAVHVKAHVRLFMN